jgi:hypothetical protein
MNLTFRRLLIFSVLTLALGIGVVYALSRELTNQNEVQVGPTAEGINEQFGLKLTLALEKTEYRLGEPINITLAITNIGNETVTYAISQRGYRFDFRVYNSSLSDIYQWSRWLRFAAIWDEIALEPGQSLAVGQIRGAFPWVWTQICNKDEYDAPLVNAGTYYIVGQTGPIIEVNGNHFLGEHRIVIETPPIQITLVEP